MLNTSGSETCEGVYCNSLKRLVLHEHYESTCQLGCSERATVGRSIGGYKYSQHCLRLWSERSSYSLQMCYLLILQPTAQDDVDRHGARSPLWWRNWPWRINQSNSCKSSIQISKCSVGTVIEPKCKWSEKRTTSSPTHQLQPTTGFVLLKCLEERAQSAVQTGPNMRNKFSGLLLQPYNRTAVGNPRYT